MLKIVSTTYEVEYDGWVYRLIEDEKGVFVKRTRANDPLWGHGVMVQLINEDMKFVPGTLAKGFHRFASLDAAHAFAQCYKNN